MRAEEVRVAIIHMEGTNCEDETLEAFRHLGASPERVHINQLTDRSPEDLQRPLDQYHVLAVPGGFSSGDYVRAGAIFAARLKSQLGNRLDKFVRSGKAVVGICNGFQVLVELGILPALGGKMTEAPEAVLATNDSGHYECRPTLLRYENRGVCRLTGLVKRGQVLQIPSAHTEGKFLLPLDEQDAMLERLKKQDQIVFRYVNDEGVSGGYPWNPNGSLDDIAAICSPAGNVFAMMPHPERSFHRYLHPDWTRGVGTGEGDGALIFRSIMDYVTREF